MSRQHTQQSKQNNRKSHSTHNYQTPGRVDVMTHKHPAPAALKRATETATVSPTNIRLLQRTYGNRAVSSLLQTKLTVGPVNDRYEREADRIARKVVDTTQPASKTEQPQLNDRNLQMQAHRPGSSTGGPVRADIEATIQSARGGGRPLAHQLRLKMERGFGADFSGVRVHTDSRADGLNKSLNARAFTTGRDIFFRQGAYNPKDTAGQRLVAHELTHVIQQGGVQRKSIIQRNGGTGNAPAPTVSATARKIANGHAYSKHVQTQGEYPNINSKAEFAQLVDQVMKNPSASKDLAGGRKAYWHDGKKTIVIVDPKNRDGGTAFKPSAGKSYYDRQA